jgi:hypothetical protein
MNMGFLLLAFSQISNNAGMLHYTSGGNFKVPMVVRGPGGAGGAARALLRVFVLAQQRPCRAALTRTLRCFFAVQVWAASWARSTRSAWSPTSRPSLVRGVAATCHTYYCLGLPPPADADRALSWPLARPTGVQLVACSTPANAKALLKSAIRSDNPIVFFEARGSQHATPSSCQHARPPRGALSRTPRPSRAPAARAAVQREGRYVQRLPAGAHATTRDPEI